MNTSEEQQIIINHIKQNKNVVVDACAGSGKSTTILSTALQLPHKKFLLITYNRSLRKELKDKLHELQIDNINVHTYHSLAVATYSSTAYIDKGIRKIIFQNLPPLNSQKMHYDVVVLDEAQDMTLLYYRLVLKFIRDMEFTFQLMVLGDFMQGLYEFKGSDIRFLTKAIFIWNGHSQLLTNDFVECKLQTSYRITNQMAMFVNRVMLGEERLLACREGSPVIYIRGRIERLQDKVVTEIRQLLETGIQPSDIFILGASVKGSKSYVKRIENALVESGIPCHVPMMDNLDEIDERVIEGKVVFSTYHTSKGRQRPFVFVVGFDHSYFQTARSWNPEKCPNTLYVATTRASQTLYLLEHHNFSTDRPLKFLKMNHFEMKEQSFIQFSGIPQTEFPEERQYTKSGSNKTMHYTTPTDLIKFIAESTFEEITEIIETIFVKEVDSGLKIAIPTMIKTQRGFHEDVSDLNGIAIPSLFYDYISSLYDETMNCSILYKMIQQAMNETRYNEHIFLKKYIKTLSPMCNTIQDYLLMSNIYQAVSERLYFKLKQIDKNEYNWLDEHVLGQCKHRLLSILNEEIQLSLPSMEEDIITYGEESANAFIDQCLDPYFPNDAFRFCARTDLITQNVVWELKCTNEILPEHFIQTAIYAWILRTIEPSFSRDFKIFNIRTGEIWRLDCEKNVLDHIMVELLKSKYIRDEMATDTDFVANCRKPFE